MSGKELDADYKCTTCQKEQSGYEVNDLDNPCCSAPNYIKIGE